MRKVIITLTLFQLEGTEYSIKPPFKVTVVPTTSLHSKKKMMLGFISLNPIQDGLF